MAYSRDEIIDELRGIKDRIEADSRVYFINGVITHKDYSTTTLRKWAAKYEDDEEVSNLCCKIKDILEERIVAAVTNKTLDAKMGDKALSHFHGWRDRQHLEVEGSISFIVPDIADGI